jgi:hypothetical protein
VSPPAELGIYLLEINLKGASLENKAGTRAPAIKKFTKFIKKEGLWKTLGLQEVECQ